MSGTIPTPQLLRLAADLEDLAGRLLAASDKYGDGAARDNGFELLRLARDMVRENIAYCDQFEAELNRKHEVQ